MTGGASPRAGSGSAASGWGSGFGSRAGFGSGGGAGAGAAAGAAAASFLASMTSARSRIVGASISALRLTMTFMSPRKRATSRIAKSE